MEYVRYIQALIEEQKALGAVEGEVVSRYGHIPRIAPEAYNIYTFAPLQKSDLHCLNEFLIVRCLNNIKYSSLFSVMGCIFSIAVLVSTDSKEA